MFHLGLSMLRLNLGRRSFSVVQTRLGAASAKEATHSFSEQKYTNMARIDTIRQISTPRSYSSRTGAADSKLPRRIAIVGFGNRGRYAFKQILDMRDKFQLVAICDTDKNALELSGVPVQHFTTLDELLQSQKSTTEPLIDCAYVSLPHSQYFQAIPQLLSSGIHVMKEKPAALDPQELQVFQDIACRKQVILRTASQSRFGPRLEHLLNWLPLIGRLSFVEGRRKLWVDNLGSGWRSRTNLSGGGVVNDLGWHLIDTVLNLVGDGSVPAVKYSTLLRTRPSQQYDCEDTADVFMHIHRRLEKGETCEVPCHLMISRAAVEKTDEIHLIGESGTLIASGNRVSLKTCNHSGSQTREFIIPEKHNFRNMMSSFAEDIQHARGSVPDYRDSTTTLCISAIYRKAGDVISFDGEGDLTVSNSSKDKVSDEPTEGPRTKNLGKPMQWPRITHDVEREVQTQLHRSLSIYDDSGVFATFEREFREYHDGPGHSLLFNSGTNAMSSMFFAAQLRPGDEVIFPVYGFHATCSPAMHFGIRPIFCDTTPSGNICPQSLARLITRRTKAVVITHMWGLPCDMAGILSVLADHPNIILIEDCSHAHGASVAGKPVGTFGDGAIWSLQGQKIISGGEGGISLTRHEEFYYRQLIWSHYNKRCKKDIPKDHPLSEYSLTGAGLKNRAHPLAVSVALTQLRQLDKFLAHKREFSSIISEKISSIPFLQIPDPCLAFQDQGNAIQPAWYAYVMRFRKHFAPQHLTREGFVKALHDEGLEEVDIPKSTCLLHLEPLFTRPAVLFPGLYQNENTFNHGGKERFPNAQSFYDEAIKIPIGGFKDDKAIAMHYADVIYQTSVKIMAAFR